MHGQNGGPYAVSVVLSTWSSSISSAFMNQKWLSALLIPGGALLILSFLWQHPLNNRLGLGADAADATLDNTNQIRQMTGMATSGMAMYAPIIHRAEEQVLAPTPTATPRPTEGNNRCDAMVQEAENATITGLFTVIGDNSASNGSFIQVPNGTKFGNPNFASDSYAEFCFALSAAGTYRIGGYIYAPNPESDSFYLSVNGSPLEDFIWDTGRGDGFIKDYAIPRDGGDDHTFSLDAGEHIIRVYYREADTRLDRLFIEPATGPLEPQPTQAAPTRPTIPANQSGPIDTSLPTEATYQLQPGNLNNMWPDLKAGDVVFLNPGEYTGGNITISASGTASAPIHILKTPGTGGQVIIKGSSSQNHLFNVTGDYIHIGGTQIYPGWIPDFVIEGYAYAGIRIRAGATNLRIHHIHFLNVGGTDSNGHAVRANGKNVLFEFNRIEDPAADALQVETAGGVDMEDWTIRYNYGSNRLSNQGQWAWNAVAHADFLQLQNRPANGLHIYDNLLLGYTNGLILGGSWGGASDVIIENNIILFEANGITTLTRGDVDGTWTIENNHFLIYQEDGVDGGGRNGILLNDKGGDEDVNINCNVFFGGIETIRIHIDDTVPTNSNHNIHTGLHHDFVEINSSELDLGYSMANARDLSGITKLTQPLAGADCVQGASFDSIESHYLLITEKQAAPPANR